MARDVESLVLQMSADLRRFDKSMAAMRATADRRLNEVEKRALQADRKLSQTMGSAGRNMVAALKSNLSGLAPVLAGAFSTAAVLQYADAYTALQNRLKAAGLEGAELKRVEDSLYESANRNGVAVAATAELYQRAAMARNNLGASEEQLLALVSGTSAALKLQGTSATEASGALLQLGQILGGEKVQAQEYNSLIDQLPVLLQAAADGSGRFGGEISVLTQQVKAGKVTTQEFFAALLKGLGDIEARAAEATPTVGAAFQTLNNEIGRYVGQTDAGLSATQRMALAIIALSENLDTVALVVGAVAALMGGRFVLAMTAGSGAMIANGVASVRLAAFQTAMTASLTGTTTATVVATGATRAFTAALLANPVGAVLIAVTALSAGVYFLAQRFSEAAVVEREVDRVTGNLTSTTQAYEKAVLAAATATGEARVAALAEVNALRTLQVEARVAAAEKLKLARASLAQAQAQLAANAAARNDPTNADARTRGGLNQIGNDLSGRQSSLSRIVEQAGAEIAAADAAIARIDRGLGGGRRPAPIAPAGAVGSAGGGSGPSPQDLARQRQLLDLQAEIALLRAQDRALEADARQDALDVLNLTKQFEDAGFENARAKAAAQVAALAAAREGARLADEAVRQAEGEARALDMTRGFILEMLDVQEQLALTDAAALDVRREILKVRQAERRLALEAAAADTSATEAERSAAQAALAGLGAVEGGETRALEGSSGGARQAQGLIADLRAPQSAVEQAAEAYAEIDRMRSEDVISEHEAALAKAQIDADLREQRLAGTRGMLDMLATLQNSSNKKLAALGKAAAIAQATIDGVLAVQKALASAPPPMNFIQAAVVGAVAAANVAQIAGMADGGLVSGPGGPREDRVLRRLSAGEFVVNARATSANRGLLEAINNGRMVGRANAAAGSIAAGSARPTGSSMIYAPKIDARGADRAAINRLETVLAEQAAALPGIINGTRAAWHRNKLGTRRL